MDPGWVQPFGGRVMGRRATKVAAFVAAILVVVSLIGYLGVSYLVYDGVSLAPRACWPADQANTPASYTIRPGFDQAIAGANVMPAPTDVRFASRDPSVPGAVLAGWWIPSATAGAPAVILVHGIQSCRREANVLVPAGMLYRHGYSVMLIDLRDHGDSGGDDARFAAGTEEYLDVLGAWDWVLAQGVPAQRIGLVGVSFGAASTLIAGGEEPRVAAVWADSAYSEIGRALGLYLESKGYPAFLVPGAVFWARVVAHDDLLAKSPIDELDRYAGRSLAFAHGATDPVLPPSMVTELHDRAAAAGARVAAAWTIPGAGHTEGAYTAPAEYEARLVAFFDGAIGG
jgi:fermentation-respiration switch protein FrsA (DUF1100 family)